MPGTFYIFEIKLYLKIKIWYFIRDFLRPFLFDFKDLGKKFIKKNLIDNIWYKNIENFSFTYDFYSQK